FALGGESSQHVAAGLGESDEQPERVYLWFGITPDPLLERHTGAELVQSLTRPNRVVHSISSFSTQRQESLPCRKPVILSASEGSRFEFLPLTVQSEVLRFAQNDRHGGRPGPTALCLICNCEFRSSK